jgi:valyl-tRNA synthetase
MSKSIGNVADPFDAIDTWGVDAVRFYMARVGGRFRDDVGTDICILRSLRLNEACFISKTGLLNN